MRVGLLVNPLARRNRKGRFRPEELYGDDKRLVLARLDGPASLSAALDRFAREAVEVVAVSGGDGTAAQVLTALAENGPFATRPKIALLPHGTTNMTAANVGLRLNSSGDLARLGDALAEGRLHIERRQTVRIANPGDSGPQHGMFFGAGAICRAVRKAHLHVHPRGLAGEWANGATLVQSLWQAVTGSERDRPDRFYQPTPMRIRADGRRFAEGDQLLFLVTTLDRLILRSRPFWGPDGKPLRATAIAFPMPGLLVSALKVMYGGERRSLDDKAFHSAGACSISLFSPFPFILDGEIHDAPDDEPLEITAGPAFEFVCGRL